MGTVKLSRSKNRKSTEYKPVTTL